LRYVDEDIPEMGKLKEENARLEKPSPSQTAHNSGYP
jgi:hypothetical protein